MMTTPRAGSLPRTRSAALVLAAVGVVLTMTACATGGVDSIVADPDAKAATERLLTPEGAAYDLHATVASHDATVLVWWASTCPCVKRYRERFNALRGVWSAEDVALVAVASNADDGPEQIANAGTEWRYDMPLVVDRGGELADRLGVVSTPTTVVLDRQGRVRYIGWLDNERTPEESGRQAWLEDAVNRTLKGDPGPSRAPVYGCTITRSLGEEPYCVPPKPKEPPPCHGDA